MLTASEVNTVQGLLNYLNKMQGEVKPDDITFIDSNGEQVARIGFDAAAGEYVLLSVSGA